MSYIALMLILVSVPLLAGYRWAAERPAALALGPLRAFLIAMLAVGIWFAFSLWARAYSDTDRPGWAAAEWWAQTGKWYAFVIAALFFLGVAFRREKPPYTRRRVATCSIAVLLVVWLTAWRTIPVYAFLPRTVTRDATGCIRQTVPFTCGPAALANLAELYGRRGASVTERELARVAGTTWEGTTMGGLIRAAREAGMRVVACRRMSLADLDRQGMPAIVFISTVPSVRHAILYVRTRGDEVEAMDPDRGRIGIPRQRFTEVLYGKALVLQPGDLAPAVTPSAGS